MPYLPGRDLKTPQERSGSVGNDFCGNLAKLGVVGTGVVTAEQEVSAAGKDDADCGTGTAAVAAVSSRNGGHGRNGRDRG
jgi:hypothetical protein